MMPEDISRSFVREGGLESLISHLQRLLPTHDTNTIRAASQRFAVNRAVSELQRVASESGPVGQYFALQDALSEARRSGTRSARVKAAKAVDEAKAEAFNQWVNAQSWVGVLAGQPLPAESSLLESASPIGKW